MGKSNAMSNSNKLEIGGKIINRDREIVYSDRENNLNMKLKNFIIINSLQHHTFQQSLVFLKNMG